MRVAHRVNEGCLALREAPFYDSQRPAASFIERILKMTCVVVPCAQGGDSDKVTAANFKQWKSKNKNRAFVVDSKDDSEPIIVSSLRDLTALFGKADGGPLRGTLLQRARLPEGTRGEAWKVLAA